MSILGQLSSFVGKAETAEAQGFIAKAEMIRPLEVFRDRRGVRSIQKIYQGIIHDLDHTHFAEFLIEFDRAFAENGARPDVDALTAEAALESEVVDPTSDMLAPPDKRSQIITREPREPKNVEINDMQHQKAEKDQQDQTGQLPRTNPGGNSGFTAMPLQMEPPSVREIDREPKPPGVDDPLAQIAGVQK